METHDRRVRQEHVGELLVSTVFLGLDHNWFDVGPPVLFETMIFGYGDAREFQRRYCTWEEAEEGHRAAVATLKANQSALEAVAKDQAGALIRQLMRK